MGQSYSEVKGDAKDKILEWLRVYRKTSKAMVVQWQWRSPDVIAHQLEKAQILCVYEGGAFAKSHQHPINLQQEHQEIANLHSETIYRICLQIEPSKNFSVTSTAGSENDFLYCIDASTKQQHLSAAIGSTIGAVLAICIVFLLVLISKRRQRIRKLLIKDESPKKNTRTDNQYDANSVSKMDMDLEDGGIYDGSEERRSSAISEETFTPPPPPPPPPSLCNETTPFLAKETTTPAVALKDETTTLITNDKDSKDKPAENVKNNNTTPLKTSPILNKKDEINKNGKEEIQPVSNDNMTVIHMNDLDEYSIDLTHCNSVSRQHSLQRANTHPLPSSTQEKVENVMTRSDGNRSTDGPVSMGSHPALYTQIIETL